MNTVLIATVFPAPCNVLANHGEELSGSEELVQCLGMCAALVKGSVHEGSSPNGCVCSYSNQFCWAHLRM